MMSAFVVDKGHVDALVATAVFGPIETNGGIARGISWYGIDDPDTGERLMNDDADRIGLELWTENVRSVEYRYPDIIEEGTEYPGPLDFTPTQARGYSFRATTRRLSAVGAIKAAHSLQYQSCEHPGWKESWSARFLTELVDSLTYCLPGYSEAPWEVGSDA